MSKTQALNKLLIVTALLIVLLVTLQTQAQTAYQTLHQNLDVALYPSLKVIKAEAQLNFPKGSARKLTFQINKNLNVTVSSHGDTIEKIRSATGAENKSEYVLHLSSQDNSATLQYQGIIHDPVVNEQSRGLISPEGVALFGSSYWYPVFANYQNTFDIKIETPQTWKALTQGQIVGVEQGPSKRVTKYKEIYPQEDIYLVAGAFTQFEKQVGSKTYQVLLRKNDATLAQTYLDLIPGYVDYFSEKIGPYPYAGFTVVENFWETGFGMPGFTLLGPSVIRLPYILNSSLPHEILHNWWGNGVYVDTSFGNWSEGLTTYMADHAFQAENNQDATYRLNTLINYQDFVTANPQKEFALKDFKSREDASSQAIGYGKSMFLFHMLELRVGKDLFKKAFQSFYQNNLFKKASYQDIQKVFEKTTNQDLELFFQQWLEVKGAPRLVLENIRINNGLENTTNVTYRLRQEGPHIYDLIIPIEWTLASGAKFKQTARLNKTTGYFSFSAANRPLELSVDPNFNVFRKLHTQERPATLSSLFGSQKVHFFYDARETDQIKFAQTWAGKIQGASHFSDVAVDPPKNQEGDWVVIGDHPHIRELMKKELAAQDFILEPTTLQIQGQFYKSSEVSTVLVTRSKSPQGQNIVWVRWATDNDPKEWAERLTHYGTFGILVFKGRPAVQRGTWPVLNSPLKKKL